MQPVIDRQSLQALYRYNAHANALLLDALVQLDDGEYNEVRSPNYTSIRKLATHSFMVERFFLAQCQEHTPEPIDPATAEELRTAWLALNQAIADYLATTGDDEINRPRVVTLRQHPFEFPAWQLLTQALMHSTHHRGELALMLGAIGHGMPEHDIIRHFWEQTGQPWP
ncbi:MAG TPA: DinB family protein [Herpetosiphonaceae bacterium]